MDALSVANGTTLQQTDVNVQNNITPEQEEEFKLKSKYPNTQKPGGSQFILKMLTKGNKKYFDSGDYNMAKSKNKSSVIPISTLPPILSHNNCPTPSTPNSVYNSNKSADDSLLSQNSFTSSPCVQNVNHHSCINYSNDILLTTDNLIDENTIGHEIPTPECLPSRKHHSNVQSKLATSELS